MIILAMSLFGGLHFKAVPLSLPQIKIFALIKVCELCVKRCRVCLTPPDTLVPQWTNDPCMHPLPLTITYGSASIFMFQLSHIHDLVMDPSDVNHRLACYTLLPA